jgi:hypothetical protein
MQAAREIADECERKQAGGDGADYELEHDFAFSNVTDEPVFADR